MKESLLFKIALLTSLTGLVLLYFLADKIEIDETALAKIDQNAGDFIKVKGVVTKLRENNATLVLQIEQPATVTVVFFKSGANISIHEHDTVEVLGKVNEFNGREQITADKIRVIG